jgi:hypothetical protein
MKVIMKCLNEQKTCQRVVADFHDEPWVDEIIVVDGGSSDYTVNLLKKFPKVKVFIHPWLDWYHDMEITQANILKSYVPLGEIYLNMDFDERMTSELKEYIGKVNETKKLPDDADIVHIARRTIEVLRYPDSPHAIIGPDGWPIESHQIGMWPDYQCRLLKRDYKFHWINAPHRILIGWEKNYNLDPSNGYILHYQKDDLRDREMIEKRWLRPQAERVRLGLPADMHETAVLPEYSEGADPSYWVDRR